jgi:hypothetical protein
LQRSLALRLLSTENSIFSLQAKYATISDIVIYHPDGLCSSALNVAERAAEALEDVWHERKMAMEIESDPVRYNIFVVLG